MRKIDVQTIESYRNHLIDEEKSNATIEKYIRDITEFNSWAADCEIDKRTVLEYKEKLMAEYKPRSVNSILSSLNSFFNFFGWQDCKVKTIKIQHQIFADKNKELTEAEYGRLLRAAEGMKNRRLYYLMQTICSTGIRVSELRFITVDAVYDGWTTINRKGKMRTVILPAKLCKILKKYVKEQGIKSGSVFVSKNGKPLNRTNIWADMKKLCDTAGVDRSKVFPHNLRHLFARTYYSLEHDIVRLADILGHSSINTTRIYTMDSGEVHRRQIDRLNLLRC